MPEGLNPIETGKKLHEHGEAAEHQRAEESDGHGKSEGRHSRIVQIGEAALLALVTLTAAWAGYSAAKWGTASRIDIAESSTLRNLATRDDLTAISLRNFDSSTFNAWYIAFTLNSPQKEAIAVRRFRPEFRVGNNAGAVGDDYVRITVFLAAVLFLVGIGSSFKLHGVRYGLIALGSVLLVVSIVLILQQPGPPS